MDIKWLIIAFAVLGKLCFYHIFHHFVTPLFNYPQSWLIRCPFNSLHELVAVSCRFWLMILYLRDTLTRMLHVNNLVMLDFFPHRDVSMTVDAFNPSYEAMKVCIVHTGILSRFDWSCLSSDSKLINDIWSHLRSLVCFNVMLDVEKVSYTILCIP